MLSSDRFFDANGFIFDDAVAVTGGVFDPSNTPGYDLPVGSKFFRANGETWTRKSTGWALEQHGVVIGTPGGTGGNGSGSFVEAPLAVSLIADFPTVSVAYIDTGLYVDLLPDTTYWIGGYWLFSSNAANNGIGFAYSIPNDTVAFGAQTLIPESDLVVKTMLHSESDEGGVTNSVWMADRAYFAHSNGMIKTGASGGRLMVRLRSETTSGVKLLRGSALRLERLL